jgi:hypothetical protein
MSVISSRIGTPEIASHSIFVLTPSKRFFAQPNLPGVTSDDTIKLEDFADSVERSQLFAHEIPHKCHGMTPKTHSKNF